MKMFIHYEISLKKHYFRMQLFAVIAEQWRCGQSALTITKAFGRPLSKINRQMAMRNSNAMKSSETTSN